MQKIDRSLFTQPDKIEAVLSSLPPASTMEALAMLFRALGDPTRVHILQALCLEDELCVGDIAAMLSLTSSAISHQLSQLRQVRLVRSRREGKLIFYMIDDDHVKLLFRQGFAHVLEQFNLPHSHDKERDIDKERVSDE